MLSWSYETLSTDAAHLFRLLAVHPGPAITVSVAGSLAALPSPRVHALLTELAEANLVTEGADGRYAFHDLLRTYAVELGEQADAGTSRRTALRRMTEHYLHTAQRGALLMDPQLAPVGLPRRRGVEWTPSTSRTSARPGSGSPANTRPSSRRSSGPARPVSTWPAGSWPTY